MITDAGARDKHRGVLRNDQAMTLTAAQRSENARKAGLARAKAFTPEYQRAARARQSSESLAERGRKGYNALVAKLGKAGALQIVAEYRREHPSRYETQLAAALDDAGIPYRREVVIGEAIADFVIDETATVIEVNGGNWHNAANDFARDFALMARTGYRVTRINAGGNRDELSQIIADRAALWRAAGYLFTPDGDLEI